MHVKETLAFKTELRLARLACMPHAHSGIYLSLSRQQSLNQRMRFWQAVCKNGNAPNILQRLAYLHGNTCQAGREGLEELAIKNLAENAPMVRSSFSISKVVCIFSVCFWTVPGMHGAI